jgi:RNA polymerase sigma-B factor
MLEPRACWCFTPESDDDMSVSHAHPGAVSGAVSLSRDERSRRTAELLELVDETSDEPRRQALLDEVVLVNLCVARSLAHRYSGRGIEVEDLEQVASEALIKAAARFDRSRGKDFLSFAVPTVRGELQRYFRDVGWVVRPTRRVQEARWAISRAEADLTQRLGRTPESEEVMDELELTPEEFAEAGSAHGCFAPTSLDRPTSASDDSATLGELIPDEDAGLPACEARAVLAPVVQMLSERDRRVLFLRFFEDLGQKEIGSEIGVTQTQVSRILDRILGELHGAIVGEEQDEPPAAGADGTDRP